MEKEDYIHNTLNYLLNLFSIFQHFNISPQPINLLLIYPFYLHESSILLDIAIFSPISVQTGSNKSNVIISLLFPETKTTLPPTAVDPTLTSKVSPFLISCTYVIIDITF